MIKNVFDWSEYDAVSRNLLYPKKRDFTTKERVVDEDAFKVAKEEYRVKREMLEKIFITALFDYLGIISHPKRFKLYELANEYSSDRSYQDIAMNAEDLARLLV